MTYKDIKAKTDKELAEDKEYLKRCLEQNKPHNGLWWGFDEKVLSVAKILNRWGQFNEISEVIDFFETMTIGAAQKPEEDDIKAYVINNTTMILQTIRDLKSSMTTGVTRLQNWFEAALRDGVKDPLGDLEYQLWDLVEKVKNATGIKDDDST